MVAIGNLAARLMNTRSLRLRLMGAFAAVIFA